MTGGELEARAKDLDDKRQAIVGYADMVADLFHWGARAENKMKAKPIYGVPCSHLKDRIKDIDVNCTSEEEAMALAAGAWLAGEKPLVYMQNSGLCRCLDIILSLYKPYGIPLPRLILSVRHRPHHHHFAGQTTQKLLDLVGYEDVEIVE